MCTFISSKFKKTLCTSQISWFIKIYLCTRHKPHFLGKLTLWQSRFGAKMYRGTNMPWVFRCLPAFVPLPQTGKVVWELSNRSGMKLSTFSATWESSCVKEGFSWKWLQSSSPQSFTIPSSRCLPHSFLALLLSLCSPENRPGRSPSHSRHQQRSRGIPGALGQFSRAH